MTTSFVLVMFQHFGRFCSNMLFFLLFSVSRFNFELRSPFFSSFWVPFEAAQIGKSSAQIGQNPGAGSSWPPNPHASWTWRPQSPPRRLLLECEKKETVNTFDAKQRCAKFGFIQQTTKTCRSTFLNETLGLVENQPPKVLRYDLDVPLAPCFTRAANKMVGP